MQRAAFAPRTTSWRLGLLAVVCAFALSCKHEGRIGRVCNDGDCSPPVGCPEGGCKPPPCEGDACNPPLVCTPDRCDPSCAAGSCAPPMDQPSECDAASCEVVDACANGACEVDACANGACEMVDAGCTGLTCAAPSCDGGTCQPGVCDGGVCEPELGCNVAYPICARCQDNGDCSDDREDPYCDTTRGRCVECLINAHCVSVTEPFCIAGECEECIDDDDCPGTLRCSRDGDCGID